VASLVRPRCQACAAALGPIAHASDRGCRGLGIWPPLQSWEQAAARKGPAGPGRAIFSAGSKPMDTSRYAYIPTLTLLQPRARAASGTEARYLLGGVEAHGHVQERLYAYPNVGP
jgi:hypothetical protein